MCWYHPDSRPYTGTHRLCCQFRRPFDGKKSPPNPVTCTGMYHLEHVLIAFSFKLPTPPETTARSLASRISFCPSSPSNSFAPPLCALFSVYLPLFYLEAGSGEADGQRACLRFLSPAYVTGRKVAAIEKPDRLSEAVTLLGQETVRPG